MLWTLFKAPTLVPPKAWPRLNPIFIASVGIVVVRGCVEAPNTDVWFGMLPVEGAEAGAWLMNINRDPGRAEGDVVEVTLDADVMFEEGLTRINLVNGDLSSGLALFRTGLAMHCNREAWLTPAPLITGVADTARVLLGQTGNCKLTAIVDCAVVP